MFFVAVVPLPLTVRLIDQLPLPSELMGMLKPAQVENSRWNITAADWVCDLPELTMLRSQVPDVKPGNLVNTVTLSLLSWRAVRSILFAFGSGGLGLSS